MNHHDEPTSMSRDSLRQDGAATLKKLFGSTTTTKSFANLTAKVVFGGV